MYVCHNPSIMYNPIRGGYRARCSLTALYLPKAMTCHDRFQRFQVCGFYGFSFADCKPQDSGLQGTDNGPSNLSSISYNKCMNKYLVDKVLVML